MTPSDREALKDVERYLQDAADAVARVVVDTSLSGRTREFAQKLMIKVAKLQLDVEEARTE